MSMPQLPQRPIPPVQHVWVAGPGDGRRLHRSTVFRIPGVIRAGIVLAIYFALVILVVVVTPSHDITPLLIWVFFAVLIIFSLWRINKARTALMTPGSVWASGFGASELLLVTPISTTVIDYAALRAPRVIGSGVLIQNRRPGGISMFPIQLFPPEAIAFLRQHTMQPS